MRINQITVKPSIYSAEASSKRTQSRVNQSQRPSSSQPAGRSLSDRSIKCVTGIIAVCSAATSALCGIVATMVWNHKVNKCTYDSSACHLIDLDSGLVATLSILAATTTCLALNQVTELCTKKKIQ